MGLVHRVFEQRPARIRQAQGVAAAVERGGDLHRHRRPFDPLNLPIQVVHGVIVPLRRGRRQALDQRLPRDQAVPAVVSVADVRRAANVRPEVDRDLPRGAAPVRRDRLDGAGRVDHGYDPVVQVVRTYTLRAVRIGGRRQAIPCVIRERGDVLVRVVLLGRQAVVIPHGAAQRILGGQLNARFGLAAEPIVDAACDRAGGVGRQRLEVPRIVLVFNKLLAAGAAHLAHRPGQFVVLGRGDEHVVRAAGFVV